MIYAHIDKSNCDGNRKKQHKGENKILKKIDDKNLMETAKREIEKKRWKNCRLYLCWK